jgi:DNA invertase Pin-like site-specific DNA recombinase
VVLVWASDRIARSVRHFLEVLDELNHLGRRRRCHSGASDIVYTQEPCTSTAQWRRRHHSLQAPA